jgi:hypothetical protein
VQCSDDEIGLAAEARVDASVCVGSIGLLEEVDLHGCIDRKHHRLSRDRGRVVGSLGSTERHTRIVV